MRSIPVVLAVLLLVLGTAGCAAAGAPSSSGSVATASDSAPCRSSHTRITHVVWILMENKASSKVVGSKSAPYFNSLAQRCGLATNDHGVAHPSLPNYIALTSGRTQGIADDQDPIAHPLRVPSIFSQLDAAGRTWKSYEEAMPGNCRRTDSGHPALLDLTEQLLGLPALPGATGGVELRRAFHL